MLPYEQKPNQTEHPFESARKRERKFPALHLNDQSNQKNGADATIAQQPVLVIQSPKTPTLSRKLKAISLDSSDASQKKNLDVSRDVSSVPNTPKKQAKVNLEEIENELDDMEEFGQRLSLTPYFGSNLKRFASNQSISGSQTLKTLPEVMTLQEFSGGRTEPVRIKAKGLLERRGSNASLTIDLGSNSSLAESKPHPLRLNTTKSFSNLNLSALACDKCVCVHKNEANAAKKPACGNCTIYESIPSLSNPNKAAHSEVCKCTLKFLPRYYVERHCVCNLKCRRKSLSNENLYVPPCNFCHFGSKDCFLGGKACNKGSRKALYPRQTYIETSQLLSEDFKLHLQNIQYLQTAGSVLSVAELKSCCQMDKIPRLHQEFWEVPLNLQEKCLVSGSQNRNRYRGVLPNEHSRVHLPGPQPYIHANYIKGPDYTETAYIATQGPMSHTCTDFWNMVWSNQVQRIVMLTALIERGRNKCELYFPLGTDTTDSTYGIYSEASTCPGNTNVKCYNSQCSYDEDLCQLNLEHKTTVDFHPFTIAHLSKETLGECVIRTLELSKSTETETRRILHYWYPNWADHKLANPEQVLRIALHVLDVEAQAPRTRCDSESRDPVVVHCSAGIGRTGCFLAILNGIQQLRANRNVDILAIVCSLRLNRGGMVQTAEQYELIHRVLSLYADLI